MTTPERFSAAMGRWADEAGTTVAEATRRLGSPPEPKNLLAVVEDPETMRRWFRWAYDSHTSGPWELMGTVHVGGEDVETFRWEDLPPVRLVSEGVPVCGCSSCGGPR